MGKSEESGKHGENQRMNKRKKINTPAASRLVFASKRGLIYL
jgi:hypothetical protein